jgi:hypothetical protein
MKTWTIISVALVILIVVVGTMSWRSFQADQSGLSPSGGEVLAKAEKATAIGEPSQPEIRTGRTEAVSKRRSRRIVAAGQDGSQLSYPRKRRRSRAYIPSARIDPAPQATVVADSQSQEGAEWVHIPGTRDGVWPKKDTNRPTAR